MTCENCQYKGESEYMGRLRIDCRRYPPVIVTDPNRKGDRGYYNSSFTYTSMETIFPEAIGPCGEFKRSANAKTP